MRRRTGLRAVLYSLLLSSSVPALAVPSAASSHDPIRSTPDTRAALRRSGGAVVPVESRDQRSASAPRRSRLYTTADTISVFLDNLESLVSPGNEGGWTHVDESAEPTAWNISSLYACGSNAFWCGIVDSSWTGDPNRRGYANSWVQTLQNFADMTGAPSPYTISFKHRMNIESGFDHGFVEALTLNDDWITLASYTGVVNDSGPTLCNTATITIPDSIVAQSNPLRFRFRFESDIEGSSEDGEYPAAEGWSIDDVTVKGGAFDVRFQDDMEAGIGTWTRSIFPSVGDYWKIVTNPPTQEVCTTNPSKVWQVINDVSGALVPRLDDKLISPAIAVNQSDQVFLFFDVYRDLSFDACFYYDVTFRTKDVGAPGWSAWIDPSELLYFGVEREWMTQTVPLAGAAGVDSIQFRIGVKDYGPILCGGSQTSSGTNVLFDNFRVGVLGAAGPSITAAEVDLYNDTFRITPFFGNDNFNTPHGDSVSVSVGAARGLKTAFLMYSLNNAPFTPVALTKVGPAEPDAYFADVPAGSYARGTALRYYFSATDSTDVVATLPADALASGHYYRATILPGIHATSGGCPDDTARILYVNALAGPDATTGVDVSLNAIGARYDRFDVNAPELGAGNTPGGGDPGDPAHAWPAASLATLGIYKAIVWDVGDRSTNTLSAQDQPLLQSWLGLLGKDRGLLLAGDNLAYDLVINGQGIPNFATCTLGAQFLRDTWENSPQDSLTPTLVGAAGTRINLEVFPVDGGCPGVNRFDALAVSSCVGANGRAWLRYPNALLAGTERLGALGAPGGDSLRSILFGFSLAYMPNAVRRNLLLYRTLVNEFENPSCYPATGVPTPSPAAVPAARLFAPAPNPFNPQASLRFELGRDAHARVRIFGVDGKLIRTLADRAFPSGIHHLRWDGRDDRGREVASGAYFLRLEADGQRVPGRKLVLLR